MADPVRPSRCGGGGEGVGLLRAFPQLHVVAQMRHPTVVVVQAQLQPGQRMDGV